MELVGIVASPELTVPQLLIGTFLLVLQRKMARLHFHQNLTLQVNISLLFCRLSIARSESATAENLRVGVNQGDRDIHT